MIHTVPFKAEHYDAMRVQSAQAWMQENVKSEDLRGLENPYAVTVMDEVGPLACAGLVVYWTNRALLWSFFSDRVNSRNMVEIHLIAQRHIDAMPFRRLEASVNVGYEQGHRWMRLLGFKVETPFQEAFQPDGSDSVGYVRIK